MQDGYENLISALIKDGYLKSSSVISAFRKINRRDFVLDSYLNEYDANMPLPIGLGQTISQPLTVAFMLELLEVRLDDRVLDIGCGSGWTTALLAEISGAQGKVFGVELLPKLCQMSIENIAKYNFIKSRRVEIVCSDGSQGLPDRSPFDRILVSAAAEEIPPQLKEQLKIGGRLVIPRGGQFKSQEIVVIEKKSADKFFEQSFPGFVFVPLV